MQNVKRATLEGGNYSVSLIRLCMMHAAQNRQREVLGLPSRPKRGSIDQNGGRSYSMILSLGSLANRPLMPGQKVPWTQQEVEQIVTIFIFSLSFGEVHSSRIPPLWPIDKMIFPTYIRIYALSLPPP